MSRPSEHLAQARPCSACALLTPESARPNEPRARVRERRVVQVPFGTGPQIRDHQPEDAARPEHAESVIERWPEICIRQMLENVAGENPLHGFVSDRQAVDDIA